jgi:hypothetical protein
MFLINAKPIFCYMNKWELRESGKFFICKMLKFKFSFCSFASPLYYVITQQEMRMIGVKIVSESREKGLKGSYSLYFLETLANEYSVTLLLLNIIIVIVLLKNVMENFKILRVCLVSHSELVVRVSSCRHLFGTWERDIRLMF